MLDWSRVASSATPCGVQPSVLRHTGIKARKTALLVPSGCTSKARFYSFEIILDNNWLRLGAKKKIIGLSMFLFERHLPYKIFLLNYFFLWDSITLLSFSSLSYIVSLHYSCPKPVIVRNSHQGEFKSQIKIQVQI